MRLNSVKSLVRGLASEKKKVSSFGFKIGYRRYARARERNFGSDSKIVLLLLCLNIAFLPFTELLPIVGRALNTGLVLGQDLSFIVQCALAIALIVYPMERILSSDSLAAPIKDRCSTCGYLLNNLERPVPYVVRCPECGNFELERGFSLTSLGRGVPRHECAELRRKRRLIRLTQRWMVNGGSLLLFLVMLLGAVLFVFQAFVPAAWAAYSGLFSALRPALFLVCFWLLPIVGILFLFVPLELHYRFVCQMKRRRAEIAAGA